MLRNSFLRPGFLEAEEPGKVGVQFFGRIVVPIIHTLPVINFGDGIPGEVEDVLRDGKRKEEDQITARNSLLPAGIQDFRGAGDAELMSPATITPSRFFFEWIQPDERGEHLVMRKLGSGIRRDCSQPGFLLPVVWFGTRPVFPILAVREIG